MLKKILNIISNGKAALIKTNGQIVTIKPKNGTDFQLKELYKAMNCDMIEIVYPLIPNTILICDEEGMLKDNYQNMIASALSNTTIVGDVVLCPNGMLK